MQPQILIPVADGTEELEAVTLINVLRRAGAEVTVAAVDTLQVTASRGVKLVADVLIDSCRAADYDMIVLPGGMPGAEHLRDSAALTALLRRQRSAGRWYGAICAAPAVVLAHHGLLEGERATCHPAFLDQLPAVVRRDQAVVVSGRCITSQGAGTAMAFALQLVEVLFNGDTAATVAAGMVVSDRPV